MVIIMIKIIMMKNKDDDEDDDDDVSKTFCKTGITNYLKYLLLVINMINNE